MSTVETEILPIDELKQPRSAEELAQEIAACHENETAVYPLGGQTSLDFGLPAKESGIGVSTSELNRIVDYPARDMTITVEAGITMSALAATLAAEHQRLPVDVPASDEATLGGVVATNFNGPLRCSAGSLRDHVIGIEAVDGRGKLFHGGGRVVKNVAGYDFCKLLTGSLGTLGVITQLTLKLKPIPEVRQAVACRARDLAHAEQMLAALSGPGWTPAAIQLLAGPAWDESPALHRYRGLVDPVLLVVLEGTAAEAGWMKAQLQQRWNELKAVDPMEVADDDLSALWQQMVEFPADKQAALVLHFNVVPSGVTEVVSALQEVDPHCSCEAHAGTGTVFARFSEIPADGLSRTLVGQFQAVAAHHHGSVVVLSNPSGVERTYRSVWGTVETPVWLMRKVKQAFDPKNILNPGRFVY